MKKKKLIVFCFAALIIIIYQTFQFIIIKSVENVKSDFFDTVSGERKEGVDYGVLIHFDHSDSFEIKTVDTFEFEIHSAFHNNKKGYMIVDYYVCVNDTDKNNSWGAGNSSAKFYIEKQNNRWVVVKIEEQFGAVMGVYEVNEEGDITMSTRDLY